MHPRPRCSHSPLSASREAGRGVHRLQRLPGLPYASLQNAHKQRTTGLTHLVFDKVRPRFMKHRLVFCVPQKKGGILPLKGWRVERGSGEQKQVRQAESICDVFWEESAAPHYCKELHAKSPAGVACTFRNISSSAIKKGDRGRITYQIKTVLSTQLRKARPFSSIEAHSRSIAAWTPTRSSACTASYSGKQCVTHIFLSEHLYKERRTMIVRFI